MKYFTQKSSLSSNYNIILQKRLNYPYYKKQGLTFGALGFAVGFKWQSLGVGSKILFCSIVLSLFHGLLCSLCCLLCLCVIISVPLQGSVWSICTYFRPFQRLDGAFFFFFWVSG